jgi:hypothetical protein
MKTFFLSFFAFLFSVLSAKAQTYTMNWGGSFFPSWSTGNTSGTAYNVGSSGVKCTVSTTKTGGVFSTIDGSSGTPMTPTVASTALTVPSSSHNLQLTVDYASNTNHTDIIVTFDQPVYNVSFRIADIDKPSSTSNSYYDRVSVTGFIGQTSGSPTITKYDATTDPNFLIISGGSAWVNPTYNKAGNTASDASDQRGTVFVRFRGLYITSMRIRYDNYPGADADPIDQAIAIGNITFSKSPALPVNLSSFNGRSLNNCSTALDWQTSEEMDFDHFVVERSSNGFDFSELAEISKQSHNSKYAFLDNHVTDEQCYYRLKMVDKDGSWEYSKIVIVTKEKLTTVKVYPTVITDHFTVSVNSEKNQKLNVSVISSTGETIYKTAITCVKGGNNLTVSLPGSIPRGQYFVLVGEGAGAISVLKQ